jgi:oligopeptide/dipeptide ABC transporter ATP-binding protein
MDSESEHAPLLSVQDLRVDFASRPTVHAVRGLAYAIAQGEALGMVGESGSGKSASALALLGLLPARTARVGGSAWFEGHDLLAMSGHQLQGIRGKRIAMIFQDPLSSLNPCLTIGRQITEALETHGSTRQSALARAIQLLELVGVPAARSRINSYPHEFSGGMRQRVMIAMALSCEPVLLIADEPTTALDVTIQAQILDLLEQLRRELRMAVLLITHDLGIVAGFAQHVAVVYAGRVVETGPTEEVLAWPRHPYTLGLLNSVPRIDRPRQRTLRAITGLPPDLAGRLVGCPFAPRCGYRLPICDEVDPPLEVVTDAVGHDEPDSTHWSACHNRLALTEGS